MESNGGTVEVENTKFQMEVIDRLARIETNITNMAKAATIEIKSCQTEQNGKIKAIEEDIKEIKDRKVWWDRTLYGLIIMAVYEVVKMSWKG